MARDEDGMLIDPFNGADDLSAGILRHVSSAFVEDPVRILRVARFAARFGFDIAEETATLMREIVARGEADALVPERVWQELVRGLMEARPSRVFEVLEDSGALARIAPEIAVLLSDRDAGEAALAALDAAAATGAPLHVRFAALARALDPYAVEALAARLKLPSAVRELALLAARHANTVADAESLTPEAVLELLDASDAWRRPERFSELVAAALAGEPNRGRATQQLERARAAAARIDAGAIAKASGNPEEIRTRLTGARLEAIRAALTTSS
jgi:tRNA nucleotidyltransferase (CCA-adding enzyme)